METSYLWKILASVSMCIAMILLACSGIEYYYHQGNLFKPFSSAASLGPAGVKKGQGFITSSLLIQDDRLGKVMDITPDRQDPTLIWVASNKNTLSVRPNGQVVDAVPVPIGAFHFRWFDLDNKTALLNTGSWITPAFLLGSDGNIVWRYSPEGGINNMTACFNILGDSKTEFVVGFNGSKGVQLLDETGKLVWQVADSNVWHVEAQDLNEDGKVKIVHSNGAGSLVVRNSDGTLSAEFKPPLSVSDFTLTDWINSDGPTAAVLPDQTKYMFYSFARSAPVTEWETGFKLTKGKTRAKWVVWNPSSGKSLALLTTFQLGRQALLTIYSEAGEMQYQELFPEATEGFGVVDGPTPGSHVLLVGLEGKVLQYQKPQ